MIRVLLPILSLACAAKPAPVALGGSLDAPHIRHEAATMGAARQRLAPVDDADLVLLYGGEQDGSVDVCGCPKRPRGSLARVETYRELVQRAQPGTPVLLLNTGGFFDDTIGVSGGLRADVRAADAWMVRGLDTGSWDALNISYRDVPYVESAGAPGAALSSSVRPQGSGFPSHRIFDLDGLRVAVAGVSAAGSTFLLPRVHDVADPVESLRALLPTLREQADVVVVLAFETGRATRDLALPGVDVLVEAGRYTERWEPMVEGDTLWVRSSLETRSLGELRLRVEQGRVVAALDRAVAMDDGIAMQPEQDKLRRKAMHQAESLQAELQSGLP